MLTIGSIPFKKRQQFISVNNQNPVGQKLTETPPPSAPPEKPMEEQALDEGHKEAIKETVKEAEKNINKLDSLTE